MNLENHSKEELIKIIKQMQFQSRKEKQYGLKWKSHEELLLQSTIPLLKKEEELSCIKDDNNLNHLLIEGDNYYALKSLLFTHKGLIDVIYIDPPYNTGNKDFIFNGSFVDVDDNFKHSKWLSFMEKRLKLAHSLLSEKGLICISIDDNEFAQLKMLCDEIFGERNFANTLIWKKRKSGGSFSKTISNQHEYILIYTKNKESFVFNQEKRNIEDIIYQYEDERGPYNLSKLDVGSLGYVKSLDFTIELNGLKAIPGVTEEENSKKRWRWKWSKESVEWGIKNNLIVLKEDNKKSIVAYVKNYKHYQVVAKNKTIVKIEEKTVPFKSLLDFVTNNDSDKEIKDIFHQKVFIYPKPKDLIKWLINLNPNKNATVLDFFAGSGTTGHAVMELNKEDNGQRQFILCTHNFISPEKEINYCIESKLIQNEKEFKSFKKTNAYNDLILTTEYQFLGLSRSITRERIVRLINGYKNPKNQLVEGLEGNNLHYYTINTFSDVTRSLLDNEVFKLKKIVDDLFKVKHQTHTMIEKKSGYSIYENNKEVLAILKSESYLDDLVEILNKKQSKNIIIYLFSWSDENYLSMLEELNKLITVDFKTENITKMLTEFYRKQNK